MTAHDRSNCSIVRGHRPRLQLLGYLLFWPKPKCLYVVHPLMKKFVLLSLLLIAGLWINVSAQPQSASLTETQRITHLLNRIGFGPRPGDIERVRQIGIDKYIDQQLHPELIDDSATDIRLEPFASIHMTLAEIFEHYQEPQVILQRLNGQAPANVDQAASRQQVQAYMQQMGIAPPQKLAQELAAQKLVRAVSSERQLQEVLTDFWYNHFNIFIGKGVDRFVTTDFEMNAIRPHVLGKFKDLLMATAKSPAMMFYLDNVLSTAPDPRLAAALPQRGANNPRQPGINENYARELMELHTLGVDGGYTQKDVQEVARAFTGWSIAQAPDTNPLTQIQRQASRLGLGTQPGGRGEFMFRPFVHDTGAKTVLGHTIQAGGGIEDGEQVLDILAHHSSTARFIATKLVRRFVSDTPPQALVDRVSQSYMKTDGDIREMMRVILTSPEFTAPEAYQAKTKSPLELVVSAIRALDGRTDGSSQLVQTLERMGQPLYRFEAPTGFPDRASYWMNNGVLVERINFGIALTANRIPGTRVDLKGYSNPQSGALYLGSPEFQKR